jgi:hypothetical protein
MTAPASQKRDPRLAALWRFAIAISILNLLGHTVLGFEPAWAHAVVALAAAYGSELAIEAVQARVEGRRPKYLGSARTLIEFLLPAHITGLAVSMLLYANERFSVIAFAAAVAIASKAVLRAPVGPARGGVHPMRHFLNPSNFGITATLVLFPSVGITPPYHFVENVQGALDWLLPCIIIATGSLLNSRLTNRMPLIAAWVGGFVAQAAVRSLMNGTPMVAGLAPMTGLAFVLFSFYMVTDPATTPSGRTGQIAFGLAVAVLYGLLMQAHITFGLFIALTIVCLVRGLGLHIAARVPARFPLVPDAASKGG